MEGKVRIKDTKVVSDKFYTLKDIKFAFINKQGQEEEKNHEVFDIGNAVTALLYNRSRRTVLLVRQFRLVAFLYHDADGLLLETCAGKIDKEQPDEAIRREIEEEMGYKVKKVEKVLEAYTTPGSVCEYMYFYVAEYTEQMKTGEGGGLPSEQEEVQVVEIAFEEALAMTRNGRIRDAKTILLLQYAQIQGLLKAE